MELNVLWFILIGVLFAGFFILEGFDYGVGIMLPFVGKTDDERRVVLNTIGGNLIVNVKESRVAISKEMAAKIMV